MEAGGLAFLNYHLFGKRLFIRISQLSTVWEILFIRIWREKNYVKKGKVQNEKKTLSFFFFFGGGVVLTKI